MDILTTAELRTTLERREALLVKLAGMDAIIARLKGNLPEALFPEAANLPSGPRLNLPDEKKVSCN